MITTKPILCLKEHLRRRNCEIFTFSKFDRSETVRDRAKMNLAGHRVRRLFGNYFEPCYRQKKPSVFITQLHASFSLVLLLLVGCFLAKRSMPREKFGSSSLVSSNDYRKVQQQELAAKLDGNFAAKCNCTRHVIYARPCVYRDLLFNKLSRCPYMVRKPSISVIRT